MTEGAPREISDKQIRDIVENTKDTSRQESHTKPNGNSLKNRIAAGMAAFAIATGVGAAASGCEYIPTERIETTVESSETEPSVTVTPTETSVKVDPVGTTETTETTPAPTETTVETTAPTETDVNVELAEAPEISGLSKEIQDGKVVYKAVEGNEYGIEAGEFAGEYNKNIVMEGEDFGNISLIPVVAEHVLNDQLEEIPDGEKKLKVLLPMDSTQAGENKINISFEKDIMDNNLTIVNCDSTIDVLNNIPSSETFYVLWYSIDKIDYMCPLSIDGTLGDSGAATNETIMNFLQTSVTKSEYFDKSKDGTVVEIPFGSIIGSTNGEGIRLSCGDSTNTYDIDSSTFVKIDNAFVSITSEQ